MSIEQIHEKRATVSVGSGALFRRSCNDCQHCLMRGELITCGMLLAEIAGDAEEGEEIDTELADGIHHTFGEECSDFLPNNEASNTGLSKRTE